MIKISCATSHTSYVALGRDRIFCERSKEKQALSLSGISLLIGTVYPTLKGSLCPFSPFSISTFPKVCGVSGRAWGLFWGLLRNILAPLGSAISLTATGGLCALLLWPPAEHCWFSTKMTYPRASLQKLYANLDLKFHISAFFFFFFREKMFEFISS